MSKSAPGKLTRIERPAGKLADLTVPQMGHMLDGLGQLETTYEKLSGVCATLRGLLLVEAKARLHAQLGHGHFMPFVKKHFAKTHKSANRYMRIGTAYLENGQSVQFEELAADLGKTVATLRERDLNLDHPVVANVARWVNGRGTYQLMLEVGEAERGGNTAGKAKKLSADEKHKLFLKTAREDFEAAFTRVDKLVDTGNWKAPSIKEAELEASVEVAQRFVKDARAWLATPKKDRTKS